jgi:uncharacterized protein YjgD (DUF1641 family)
MKKYLVNQIQVLSEDAVKEEIKSLENAIQIISLNSTFNYLDSKQILDKLTNEVTRLEELIGEGE